MVKGNQQAVEDGLGGKMSRRLRCFGKEKGFFFNAWHCAPGQCPHIPARAWKCRESIVLSRLL
jgi:hypothetical protein